MESSDEDLSHADFEFSQEELEEALKKKSGRPSNRTRELRQRIQEADRLRDLLGILDSGVLERLDRESIEGRDERSDRRPTGQVDKPDEPEGFTEELLGQTGLFSKKFIHNNRHLLKLLDNSIEPSIIKIAPVAIGLGGLWLAEEHIDGFPPFLHVAFNILTLFSYLLDTASGALNWLTGGELNIPATVKSVVDEAKEQRLKGKTAQQTMAVQITTYLMKAVLDLTIVMENAFGETKEEVEASPGPDPASLDEAQRQQNEALQQARRQFTTRTVRDKAQPF